MSGFIKWIDSLNTKDRKIRAVLRRSLAFDPGAFPVAFPYVEPFVKNEGDSWRREMHYLVAGLWALHWREGLPGVPMFLGKASAAHRNSQKGSESTERRFIAVLDSDQDQLHHRMRQMIALLKDYSLDFENVLQGLICWNDDRKRTQNQWARDFYKNIKDENESKPETKLTGEAA